MVVRGRAVAGRVARQQRVAHRVGAQRRQRIVRGQGRRGGVGEHVRAAMRRVEQRQRVARRAADRGVAGRQMRQRIGGVARLRRIQVEGVRGGIGGAAHRQGAGAEQAAEYVLGRPGAGLPAPGRIGGRVRRRLGQRCRPCVGRIGPAHLQRVRAHAQRIARLDGAHGAGRERRVVDVHRGHAAQVVQAPALRVGAQRGLHAA